MIQKRWQFPGWRTVKEELLILCPGPRVRTEIKSPFQPVSGLERASQGVQEWAEGHWGNPPSLTHSMPGPLTWGA